jgi:hypothetical protein
LAGNALVPATDATVTVDTRNPSAQLAENNTDGVVSDKDQTVSYTVTFSEAVAGLGGGDIEVTNGAVVADSIAVASDGLSATFDVKAADELTGVEALSVSIKDTVVDLSGNALDTFKGVVSLKLDVDTENPQAQSVQARPADLGQGNVDAAVTLTVAFNEAMDTNVAPGMALSPDMATSLVFDSGTWTDDRHYEATYDVLDGDVDTNVAVTVTGAVDQAGNLMGEFVTQGAVLHIDTKNPTVTGMTSDNADSVVSDGDREVTYTVTFSEAVQGLSGTDIALSDGATLVADSIVLDTSEGAAPNTYTFKVEAPDNSTDDLLVSIKDTVKDQSGNALDTSDATVTLAVDTENPEVTVTNVGVNGIVSAAREGGVTVSGTAEYVVNPDGDGNIASAVTVKFGSTVLGSADVGPDNTWSLQLDKADLDAIGYGGGKTLTAVQTDAAGNEQQPIDFNVPDFDFSSEVLSTISGLGVSGAPTTPVSGSTTLDLSQLAGDVTVDAMSGQVLVSGDTSGGGHVDSASNGGFDTFVTGAGDDRLFGSDRNETFVSGTGYDVIDGGAGIDTLDLSHATGDVTAAKVQRAEAAAQPASGKALSLANLTVSNGDLAVLNVGGRTFVAQASTDTATLVGMVSALSAQMAAAQLNSTDGVKGDLLGLTLLAPEQGLLALEGAQAGTSFELSILSAGGAVVSLGEQVVIEDSANAQNWVSGLAVSDNSWVEVTDIENLLGTGYSDILMGSDVDNVINAGDGDDIVDGGKGDDTLIGGAGDNVLYGGASSATLVDDGGKVVLDEIYYNGTGRDTFVMTLGATNSIRDFDISGWLTSDAARVGDHTLDRIEFAFTKTELAALLSGDIPDVGLAYSFDLTVNTTPVITGGVSWTLALVVNGVQVSTVNFDWASDPLAGLNGFTIKDIDLTGGSISFVDGAVTLAAALELENLAMLDTSSAETIVGARSGDVFVMTDADNLMVGGLGSDRYEARILGSGGDLGTQTINDLGRARGGAEEDAILIEGARDLGDLVNISRDTLAAEGADRSLSIEFEQFRADQVGSTDTPFATGSVEVFNQFSLTQSDVYKVEKLQIGSEFSDPLEALVKTYYFGDVLGTTAGGGDIVEAQADRDSILVGNEANNSDAFRVEAPTDASQRQEVVANGQTFEMARDDQDVWIYGMDGTEDVTISGDRAGWTLAQNAEEVVLAGGDKVFKAVASYDNGTAQDTSDDLVLNLFFQDGGNVDSSTLLSDRIKWES